MKSGLRVLLLSFEQHKLDRIREVTLRFFFESTCTQSGQPRLIAQWYNNNNNNSSKDKLVVSSSLASARQIFGHDLGLRWIKSWRRRGCLGEIQLYSNTEVAQKKCVSHYLRQLLSLVAPAFNWRHGNQLLMMKERGLRKREQLSM